MREKTTTAIPAVDAARRLASRHSARLRGMGVENLYLYGSAARGLADADSDYDFICEMDGPERDPGRPIRQGNEWTEFSRNLERIFHRPVDARNIARARTEYLSRTLPHAALIYGSKPVAQAHREYCGGEMGEDKFQDLEFILIGALVIIEKIRQRAQLKHPRLLLDPETLEDDGLAEGTASRYLRLNEALNRGSLAPFRQLTADKMPEEGWKKLDFIGMICRHPYMEEDEGLRLQHIADFHDRWLNSVEPAVRAMLDIIRRNQK